MMDGAAAENKLALTKRKPAGPSLARRNGGRMFAAMYSIDFDDPRIIAVITSLACVLLVIVPTALLVWWLYREKPPSREE